MDLSFFNHYETHFIIPVSINFDIIIRRYEASKKRVIGFCESGIIQVELG